MRKRKYLVPAGVALGAVVWFGTPHVAFLWGLFPGKDVNRALAYIREAMVIVNENYVDPSAASFDNLTHNAIHGMVESLDPHSQFLESKDNSDLEEDLSGEFGGIGIEVDEGPDHRIEVINPMPGTPGERAGIRRGDEILSIDGKTLDPDHSMDDVVDRLRGKPKSRVTVGLYRPSTRNQFSLTLVRETIKVDSVTDAHVIPDTDVGYVRITEFSENTGDQFDDAVNGLLKKNIGALIIDLRNNPGGLLDSAVDVAEPFFRKDELIVYTQGRKPSDRDEYRAEDDGDPLDIPLALIINEDTASAAEIVTGALKDTGRAVVVGERSFGKGSVQSILKLKNGEGLRLTTAKYYTPSGVSIHQKGIEPQVEVVMSAEDDDKLGQQMRRPDLTDAAAFVKVFGFKPIEDRQLDAAVDVIQGVELLDDQAAAAAKIFSLHASILQAPPGAVRPRLQFSGLPRHDVG